MTTFTAYGKYFGEQFGKLSHKTTEDEIKNVYDDWAAKYDKVFQLNFYNLTFPH